MLPEIGEKGQRRLKEASVLIVGLGGLGCPVALYLTGAGVGKIGLCDSDKVSVSNLQRQTLYSENMAGEPKSLAALERLSALSSDTEFEILSDGLDGNNAAEIIARYDIVVDCCDNFATRYLIDEVCERLGKPWIFGSIGEFDGRVSTFLPGRTRFTDIFPDKDELSRRPASSGGVIGPLPGIVGSIEAAEAMKVICGFGETLADRLLLIDIKTMTFNTIEI